MPYNNIQKETLKGEKTMTTKTYIVETSAELDLTLNLIKENIPCFIGWKFSEDDETAELTIECRNEDVAYTQKMLACFV